MNIAIAVFAILLLAGGLRECHHQGEESRLGGELKDARAEAGDLRTRNGALDTANQACAASVKTQSAAVAQLEKRAADAEAEAARLRTAHQPRITQLQADATKTAATPPANPGETCANLAPLIDAELADRRIGP